MDARYLLAFGYAATSLGLYHMATHLSLGMDFGTAAMLRTYQVAGLAFIFIPSNVLCYEGIPREKNNQVSSMMNFVRNIGGSVGIALVSTIGDPKHASVGRTICRRTCRMAIRYFAEMARRHDGYASQPGNERRASHSTGICAD